MNKLPITFLVPVYNESDRIRNVLSHAQHWAGQILIVNKSSTDSTRQLIIDSGVDADVIDVGFSLQGDDRLDEWVSYARHEWVFLGTCSEVPTKKLIEAVRLMILQGADSLDLILVPRKIFSLGIHNENSPWSHFHYPFLFHKDRAIITNKIHEHVTSASEERIAKIAYSADCCVFHFTHVSVARFIAVHNEYAKVEASQVLEPDLAIVEWLKAIHNALPGIMRTGKDWPPIFAAWAILHLMNILYTWEKTRGSEVAKYYSKYTDHLITSEWKPDTELSTLPKITSTNSKISDFGVAPLDFYRYPIFLTYVIAKIIYKCRSQIRWLRKSIAK